MYHAEHATWSPNSFMNFRDNPGLLEDGTDRLSRSAGEESPLNAA